MAKRAIEVFSAGCALCEEAIQLVTAASCSNCDVQVKDMTDPTTPRWWRRRRSTGSIVSRRW